MLLNVFSRTQIIENSLCAVHLSGPYSKIGTAQGTNQNASFHHGPVQPYNKSSYIPLEDVSSGYRPSQDVAEVVTYSQETLQVVTHRVVIDHHKVLLKQSTYSQKTLQVDTPSGNVISSYTPSGDVTSRYTPFNDLTSNSHC